MPAKKQKLDPEVLRQRLKLKNLEVKNEFSKKFINASKELANKEIELGKVREHSAKLLGVGALTGTLLLAPPTNFDLPSPNKIVETARSSTTPAISSKDTLMSGLSQILPSTISPLNRDQEKSLEKLFKDTLGVDTKATLEGEHLNTTYGKIGAEQHLRRYPGDVNANHSTDQTILKEGMAPGLGAWGYFASSKQALTPELENDEKWYAVVQTLYLPDWGTRQPYLRDWYKYRKVLIVNTENGKAVVADIADSGPAAWTGKHFGGSPEVMDYLGGPKDKKGPVIVFFVDDPENKVPLGPVNYESTNVTLNKI